MRAHERWEIALNAIDEEYEPLEATDSMLTILDLEDMEEEDKRYVVDESQLAALCWFHELSKREKMWTWRKERNKKLMEAINKVK